MVNLKAKLKKQGGFTLVEMLIVVAIIAILVAISIPLVNQALEKARDATDQANERAAKAEAVLAYLGTSDIVDGSGAAIDYIPGAAQTTALWYNAKDGRLQTTAPDEGYGKCTDLSHLDSLTDTDSGDNTGNALKVTWTVDGIVTLEWSATS